MKGDDLSQHMGLLGIKHFKVRILYFFVKITDLWYFFS